MKKSFTTACETDLIEGLKSHSRIAFSQLYDRYAATLLGVITKIVKNETEAEDLLQDTFVKVWKNIHRHDPNKGRLFTWLLNVTRNTALDYLRSRNKAPHVELPQDGYLIGMHATFNTVGYIGFSDVVNTTLDPRHWQIIELIYFKGYTQQETAEQLNLPLGTVKTWTRIALIQLRQTFRSDQFAFQ
ncbi:sigma-70 family RNA polymerase sigma factor [Larkinella knui]|uniref:RNA polymerase sigma factor n=1 Tax=Larkinella knui TaxID=2025310 RepID=A0A3P1CW45_9BACT|nr:sigma-70 family RNA polymerase sigma factor [Larkinella knui]RRB17637.1 sigma-70 family RNA polymerase sigma factor [Larkinella knui]